MSSNVNKIYIHTPFSPFPMQVDRLRDFRAVSKSCDLIYTPPSPPSPPFPPSPGETPERKYDSVQEWLAIIKRNTSIVDKLKDRERIAVNERERKVVMQEFEKTSDTMVYSKKIKNILEINRKENTKFSLENPNSTGLIQMRQNLYQMYTRRFYQAMNAYQQASRDFQRVLKDRTRRQFISPDSIDMECGMADKVLDDVVLCDVADDAVLEIQDRHEGIRMLEQQIGCIHQMFLDLDLLIDVQQESLNVIQDRIKNSKEATKEATKELHNAEKQSKKVRKRQCCIFVTILMVIVVTIVPILRSKVF
jgi:syntaxin 1B/2/3